MRAAFFAERDREALDRFRGCMSLPRERFFRSGLASSPLSAFRAARERLADFFVLLCPFLISRAACFRVSFEAPSVAGSFTPLRDALSPVRSIACLVERAPCLPSRTCSISSRTNSPACVLGALPSRFNSSHAPPSLSQAWSTSLFISGPCRATSIPKCAGAVTQRD